MIRVVVEIPRCVVFLVCYPAEEAEGFATDREHECRRKRRIEIDVEILNVFCEYYGGCPNGLTVVDESRVNPFCWMMVDYDIDGCSLRNAVVCARDYMIDERK